LQSSIFYYIFFYHQIPLHRSVRSSVLYSGWRSAQNRSRDRYTTRIGGLRIKRRAPNTLCAPTTRRGRCSFPNRAGIFAAIDHFLYGYCFFSSELITFPKHFAGQIRRCRFQVQGRNCTDFRRIIA